jgi:Flp pilus assembly protein TadG
VWAMRDFLLKLFEKTQSAAALRQARTWQRGQSLVIVAAIFIGLAMFVGLAVDGGILFVTQAHLRRAVDAAAVAAATQMRVGQRPEKIREFALQFVRMNNVDPATVTVSLYNYNNGESGITDCHHAGADMVDPAYDKYKLCGVPQRKLIRIEASSVAQFSFMPMMGIYSTTVVANAVSESASVDAVVVIDTSGSMGDETAGGPTITEASVNACNAKALVDPKNPVGNCRPLQDAKEAAKVLVRNLYPDYDRVAIVHFDYIAHMVPITDTKYGTAGLYGFSYVRGLANQDPGNPSAGLGACPSGGECDDDPNTPTVSESSGIYQALDSVRLNYDKQPWADSDPAYSGISQSTWGINWGKWNPLDYRCNWTTWDPLYCGHPPEPTGRYASFSTCTGCGIRVGGNLLKLNGRPSALWIVIFLSDGAVNISDVPDTGGGNLLLDSGFTALQKSQYPNGYCGLDPSASTPLTMPVSLWKDSCVTAGKVLTTATRICGPYHVGPANCPPGATYVAASPPYDAMDYALDMIDAVALRTNCPYEDPSTALECKAQHPLTSTAKYNYEERMLGAAGPSGGNMVIYSIGLGPAIDPTVWAAGPMKVRASNAQALLRYMATVGATGDRNYSAVSPDPCLTASDAASCGNYFYARRGAELGNIFEDIAKRVFTRLSK